MKLIPSLNRYPANIYLFKANSRNTRKRCEIYLKFNNKNNQLFLSLNFEHISHLFLVFLVLTLNK